MPCGGSSWHPQVLSSGWFFVSWVSRAWSLGVGGAAQGLVGGAQGLHRGVTGLFSAARAFRSLPQSFLGLRTQLGSVPLRQGGMKALRRSRRGKDRTVNLTIKQAPSVSRRTAQRDLVRGVKFLSTLSRVPEIRAALDEGAGYSEEDHAQGWNLLLTAMGYIRKGVPIPTGVVFPQQAALVELDEWDGVTFERTRAALKYTFPAQHDYLFQGLNAATGADAITTVQTFVERVVALQDGTDPDRAEQREEDREAVQRLAERKIFTPEIRVHIEGLLEQAKKLAPPPKSPEIEDEIQNAADHLHVWLSDWTGQARAFITRGDYLIRLGLSSRKPRGEDDGDVVVDDEVLEVGNDEEGSPVAAESSEV